MDKIEILNKEPIMRATRKYYGYLAFDLLVIIVFAIVNIFLPTKTFTYLFVTSIVMFVIFIMLSCWREEETGRYTYECKISEDAPFVKIYEKYDIIERRGEIWVLQDKGE